MNLETIQDMWKKDAIVDPDNLHHESINIPQLYGKYYEIHNKVYILKEVARKRYNQIKFDAYKYYKGEAPPEVYVEKPLPLKIRDKDALQRHIDTDPDLCKADAKLKYYEQMLKYIEDILKIINNRSFQIKNAIEFMTFTAGIK
jgi:hypothetical protein